MIPLDREIHLGHKAFVLMLLRRAGPGLVIFVVGMVLAVYRGTIENGIVTSPIVLSPSGMIPDPIVTLYTGYALSFIFLLAILLMLIGIVIGFLEYTNYTYDIEEFGLRMKRGILHQREISILYRQIQDINIDRSLFYRFLGLSKLVLLTAGHEESGERGMTEVLLEPIDKMIALRIRDMLQRKVGVQVVETEQEADAEQRAGHGKEAGDIG